LPPKSTEPRSVVEILAEQGIDETRVSASQIGRIAADLYRARHDGKEPPKIKQRIGGRPCPVSAFPEADLDLVKEAIAVYIARQGAKPPKPGMQFELPAGGAR